MIPWLSIAGRIIGNPIAVAAIVGGLAFGYGYIRGYNTGGSSVASRYERKLATLEKDRAREVQIAIEAAEAVEPLPATPAELVSLCQRDPACRTRTR